MTTQRDIDAAIEFEASQSLPTWWDSASSTDKATFAAQKADRIARLRSAVPDGVTQYAAGGALEDGPS